MTDHSQHSPLEELKEKLDEVIELLNKDNRPLIISENGERQALESTESSEAAV